MDFHSFSALPSLLLFLFLLSLLFFTCSIFPQPSLIRTPKGNHGFESTLVLKFPGFLFVTAYYKGANISLTILKFQMF